MNTNKIAVTAILSLALFSCAPTTAAASTGINAPAITELELDFCTALATQAETSMMHRQYVSNFSEAIADVRADWRPVDDSEKEKQISDKITSLYTAIMADAYKYEVLESVAAKDGRIRAYKNMTMQSCIDRSMK